LERTKYSILVDILFELLAKRKVTAVYLADKFGVSPRTIYRYVDDLSDCIPVTVDRGRAGGICIADNFKLPKGFMTTEEYESTIEALETMYAQLPQERFLEAKRKLSTQMKSESRDLALSGDVGAILVDGGTWGDSNSYSEKLKLFEESVKNQRVLEIDYRARTGESSKRKIEPHVLVFKQNVWYVYAFCHKQRAFRLFRIGRVFAVNQTEETFQKRPFSRQDVPLAFWTNDTKSVDVRFAFDKSAVPDAQDWLGVENIKSANGKWYADVTLPDDSALVKKILSLGAGVQVLAPTSLREKVGKELKQIANLYS
jgi:predicted DNA-binding transcriptional regulator YafY